MGIGRRIRTAIESQGLSLKKAAERCDISYSSLQNWAGGHREPRPEALIAIGSQLGISIDWLLTGQGSMLRDQSAQAPSAGGEAANPREQAILELYRALDEDAQREIQSAAEEKKRLKTLEQRLQELEAVVADIKRLA
ncbi:helix-turn-helix domain-containing protein [Stutzerimonas stutzeri]|uniref:helix-turn-helix domain-containing protein n=1 Tax=Stutzerimonas stutzeri TaxID=316 RepID=UPI00210AADB2|nr:helix-turn-helix domain-containing protein [Stutzerimonas stutzeri]MCQ4242495.1 helix-turn-helix domain-containing protein [Stutzerimonas stutzeri]